METTNGVYVSIPLKHVFALMTENLEDPLSHEVQDIVRAVLDDVNLPVIKKELLKYYGVNSPEELKEDHFGPYHKFEIYFGKILWR